MINWQYYPKSDRAPKHIVQVVSIFDKYKEQIQSSSKNLSSDRVLQILQKDLSDIGFFVERSKKIADKIRVPVLFGRNGKPEKSFDADAYHENTGTVLEVEAGRGVTNYQFLKDLFQACMMHKVDYLIVALRNIYRKNPDFERAAMFFDTLYSSGRLTLPLKGVLLIGY